MHYLKLLRPPNLVIIAITQALIYFGLIIPVLKRNGIVTEMGLSGFFLMFIITALITISGYLINDIIDVKTDRINKEEKQVIGQKLSIKSARIIYILILLLGFVLSFYYAINHKVLHLLFVYPLACALLAFYSYGLKGTFLLGNILVSLFSAGVTAIILLFEQRPLYELKMQNALAHDSLMTIILAFILFSFFSSVYREIIKDMEDFEGDRKNLIFTTAVIMGLAKSKKIALVAGTLFLTMIIIWLFSSINQLSIWFVIYGIFLVLMMLVHLYRLFQAENKVEYSYLSILLKIIMGLGLLYLALYCIIL